MRMRFNGSEITTERNQINIRPNIIQREEYENGRAKERKQFDVKFQCKMRARCVRYPSEEFKKFF